MSEQPSEKYHVRQVAECCGTCKHFGDWTDGIFKERKE